MESRENANVCPACDRGILNRKLDRCLYCGASLPAELLFTKEQIAALDEQQRALLDKSQHETLPQIGSDTSSWIGNAADAVEIVFTIGSLFD